MINFGPEETAARKSNYCVCGQAKEQGSVVCWDCFKRKGELSLKWFDGSYVEWLEAIKVSK